MAEVVDLKATPVPELVPVPVVKQIRMFCIACKGTGSVSITNGPLPATDTPCVQCSGTGKIVFGEMDA